MPKIQHYIIEQEYYAKEVAWRVLMKTDDGLVSFVWSDKELSDNALQIVGELLYDHMTISNQIERRYAG